MEADISIDRVAEVAARLERELAKTIVGQQRVVREVRIGRSPWWAAAFALLPCAEWTMRRRRGPP